MNLPNKLTIMRVALIPLFLVFLLCNIPHGYLLALAVFSTASLTDLLDGRIARKYGLVTDFGKLMDPLADKLLVMSALVAFIEVASVSSVVVIVVLAREFIVTSLRLIAASKGVVIAADWWGKVKTVSQMLWIICTLLVLGFEQSLYIGWSGSRAALTVCMAAALISTVLSGVNYIWNNRGLFLNDR